MNQKMKKTATSNNIDIDYLENIFKKQVKKVEDISNIIKTANWLKYSYVKTQSAADIGKSISDILGEEEPIGYIE